MRRVRIHWSGGQGEEWDINKHPLSMNTHYLDDIKSSLNFRKKTFRNVRERENEKKEDEIS